MDFLSVSFCLLYLALFPVKRFPTPLKTDFRSTLTYTGAITYQTSSLILETHQITCYPNECLGRGLGGNDRNAGDLFIFILYNPELNSNPQPGPGPLLQQCNQADGAGSHSRHHHLLHHHHLLNLTVA